MTTLEREIVINASLEAVDSFSQQPGRWPEWYIGIQQAEPGDAFPKIGSVVKVVYKAAAMTFNLTFTVVEYDYLKVIGYQIDGMMTGHTRFAISPEGNQTRLRAHFDYEVPGGGLGKIVDRLVVERMNTENLDKSLKNLKQAIEGG